MAVTFQKLIKHRAERLCKGSENWKLERGGEVGTGYKDLESQSPREMFELSGG